MIGAQKNQVSARNTLIGKFNAGTLPGGPPECDLSLHIDFFNSSFIEKIVMRLLETWY